MALAKTSVVLVLNLVQSCSGNAFLKQSSEGAQSQTVGHIGIEEMLLAEVQSFMGKGHMDANLPEITSMLEPMWLSLPKNKYGNLDHSEVRYALRRIFVQRHGWHIDGLEKIGTDVATDETSGLLRGKVPAFLMDRFQEAFGDSGLKLHELAIFAATLEHIIHDDATDRLHDLFTLLDLKIEQSISQQKATEVLIAFALSIIKGAKRISSAQNLRNLLARIHVAYPGWEDTQIWVEDLFRTEEFLESSRLNPFADRTWNFAQIEKVAQKISHQFGHFQNTDCQRLKTVMLEAEDGDTGRVRLSAFYKKFLETNSLFKESAEGLRNMGALEERSGESRVIVSNYVLAPSNCLADTGFYSICCINECEQVMAQVETAVAAPFARPDTIVSIVSNLSTTTVDASSLLPEVVARLHSVAERHGGFVPLHGRLFAQWLHVVFPRECPFPHTLGSVNTTTTAGYTASSSHQMEESKMEKYILNISSTPEKQDVPEEDLEQFHWQHEELVYRPGEQPRMARSWIASACWLLIGVAACVFVITAFADVARRCRPDVQSKATKIHLV
jgi:hypothetical protein